MSDADSDPEVSSKIAKDYPSLQFGLDTIAEGKTTVSCVKAVAAAKGEGHIMTLLTNKDEELQQYKDKIPSEMNLVCTSLARQVYSGDADLASLYAHRHRPRRQL